MIDTHCHILPGIDDGPRDVQVSIEMARVAVRDGIETIIATPHIVEGYYEAGDIAAHTGSMNGLLQREGVELGLVAGAEVPMSIALSWEAERLSRLCLGDSRHLLLETADIGFSQLNDAVFRLRLAGITPVLAHPERIGALQVTPQKLAGLISHEGVCCQITVSSLEGLFGRKARSTALGMARTGLVHLAASDAHSARTRAPRLSGAYELLRSEVSEATARTIVIENPERLLAGEPLVACHPSPRPRLLSRCLRRL